ncbi:ATP-binding protein [Amycolatopsis sp. GM8]|uniref:ATP-binding protein n=1 Tax=Amycolatopsis sp. GM8 TaxID=2896530 RepID=UPI001F26C8C5|nr:ATP-binding protein [Amycolatopsis sp. GM8]
MRNQVNGRCEVPAEPRHYTNNEAPLGQLDSWFSGSTGPRVAIVRGAPGSGRTTLANVWMQRRRQNYPDGQFFVRLASGPDGPERERAALRELLLAVGHGPGEIPDSLDGRASWWRSWTDGKRVGLVIDDALTASQVRSLLPGSGDSAVLVTEAGRLSGLLASATATMVDLDPMAEPAARQLLGRLAGAERADADPVAIDQLIAVCEGSTIALCVVGTMLAESDRPIARLADKLRKDERVLRELSKDSSLSVTVVFDAAYERLSEPARAGYQALGVHPGPADVGVDAVAAAIRQPGDDVADALEELARARLVTETGDGRFLMSGLVRRHARTKAIEPEQVVSRFLGHYLGKTVATAMMLNPNRIWHEKLLPALRVSGQDFAAEQWLDAESANLSAAVEEAYRQGQFEQVCQFAIALWPYYEHGGHTGDMVTVGERGIAAAKERGDDLAEAVLGCQLGFAHLQRGAADRAIEVLTRAQQAAIRSGSKEAMATAVESLGLAYLANGDARAEAQLRRNRLLARELTRRQSALACLHLAKAVTPDEARSLLDVAAAGLAGEPYNLTKVDLWRGRKLGDEAALRRVLEQGKPRERGEALVELSEVDSEHARTYLTEALGIFRDRGLTELSVEAEARLARLD